MKFSIITATFNSEEYILDSLKSLNEQSYKTFESIIIDGGSSDNTIENIRTINICDQTILSEKDNGIYDALNKGIKMSSGDIIGFLHSDDAYANSNVLMNISNEFKKNNSDIVYADLVYVDKNLSSKIKRTWIGGKFLDNSFHYGWMPPHPTIFIKKDIYKEFGYFDATLNISGDYDLILKIFLNKRRKLRVSYLNQKIYHMKVGGASNNHLQKFKEDYIVLRRYFNFPIFVLFCKILRKLPQIFIR